MPYAHLGGKEVAKMRSLFELVIDPADAHPSFEALRTQGGSMPARWMLERVFQHFSDPDGNFLQQLQGAGFDARIFELYLFAYFYYSGFAIDRTHAAPDFIVSRDGARLAVEATTVNPPTAGVLAALGKQIGDLSGDELTEYQRHELAVRFGSPLFTKLKRRYWELPHARDLPLVLAIEAFHDEDSLGLGDSALAGYLYGVANQADWDESGELAITFERIYSHIVGPKTIPSAFFDQSGTENVSAVLFTNAGTVAKFSRMAYQAGVGGESIDMRRVGYCSNLDKDVRDPTYFSYDVGDPPVLESWGQGLVILHNPRAAHPIDLESLPGAVHTVIKHGRPTSYLPSWHVYSSKTLTLELGELKAKLREVLPPPIPRCAVGGISRGEFHSLTEFRAPDGTAEDGWFCDEAVALLGVVLLDRRSETWGYGVLGRDEYFQFYALGLEGSLSSRFDAVRELQQNIARRLEMPQRVFPR